ncbi:hypothetical protein M8C13_04545 [Crossiella sp. SN42]|uniref:hypothetical protein n=1 Tax=Crossiella sp. SN42 TaxID=2944808 RepID=UPI00207C49C8|nr:hypothetical protein [Crossiella sp. SN42]MCO1575028.1 hypothetical protein [Crossiella sp. SN42]
MASVPAWLLRHTATIEPYLGTTGTGPRFGPPEQVRCFADDKRRLVRSATGTEVVSETTLYCPPGTTAPPESRVTVQGRATTVIAAHQRDGGGLPTPDHVEVVLK